MQIGTKFSISIHILLSAAYFKDDKVTSEFIAEGVGTNPVIVRKLMSILKSANLIITRAGVGGVSLAKAPSEISLYDVFVAVNEGENNLFKIHKNSPAACPLGGRIDALLTPHFNDAQNALNNELKGTTLQNLLNELGKR
ncbi:Rrf2 family transcriptional regulator [Campylobacter sp. faydin G-24]|uniref:Rrf2 family transcriptional regulator n=1 Tax=Campylobacter anatolicus TaxID=2829105 RepID=A0ABS5HJK6_9BACT|nr:Rrf2 family transcriptional regulator [Campylobacter anatolicus]MBR8464327.1 Rrf2 family transcriptional regulator [Campylobacter anatolicus]MBR8464980.1 Rrf2 family transcriptional regulator [Campylobacter anatolicus]